MKTSELTGAAFDWAVAKCEGFVQDGDLMWESGYEPFSFSTDWSQGGPIIEREKLTIEWTGEDWMAYIRHDEEFFGPTPLIAAMRCYVVSRLGDEIEVPEGLK